MSIPLTIGDVAKKLGCRAWQVRRLYERGILPPADRLGVYRVFHERDLPRIASALREMGYLSSFEKGHPMKRHAYVPMAIPSPVSTTEGVRRAREAQRLFEIHVEAIVRKDANGIAKSRTALIQ